jgi:protein SCO1/2
MQTVTRIPNFGTFRSRIKRFWFPLVATLLALAVIGGIGYNIWWGMTRFPVINRAPAFTLENADGKPVKLSDTDGKVRLITFFYASCTDECPLAALKMKQMQDLLVRKGLFGSQVQFLSITFDPKHDTGQVLKEYAYNYQADPKGWTFLRGDEGKTQAVLKSFGVDVNVQANDTFAHGMKTFLVDKNENIRKIYLGTVDLDKDQVVSDIERLLKQ